MGWPRFRSDGMPACAIPSFALADPADHRRIRVARSVAPGMADGMAERNKVLLIGFDPHAIPGVDADMVEMAIQMGEVRLKEEGFETDYCLVAPDDAAEAKIVESLSSRRYDCVIVGGGIRKPEEFLELFERVINLIRVHAPDAMIAFNTTGANSVDAVLRWLPPPIRSGERFRDLS